MIVKYDGPAVDAKRADKIVKICIKCQKGWEVDWETSRTAANRRDNVKVYYYYSNFPTYKKIRQVCPLCK